MNFFLCANVRYMFLRFK